MSSSYRDVSSVNISSGVKAKLQKWIGKASINVRDKRPGKEISAETMDYKALKVEVTSTLVPQHSRTRSAPIPMDKLLVKRRKSSLATTWYVNSKRENDGMDSSPKNGIPRDITHSVTLHESSNGPSSVQVERQIALDCSGKETSLGDQTGSIEVNTTDRTDKDCINGMNGYASARVESGSRAPWKLRLTRERSKTSVDLIGESGSSDNERIASAHSLDSIPQNVQQLSGQIQFRLQKWVERASHLAAQRERRPSEESASSTDESLNMPDSPSLGLTPGSANESQVKKIKELELALKELVENVGVRAGSLPSKISDATSSHSPGSSGAKRSRQNSQRHESDRQENGELNGIEKNGLLEKHSRDAHDSKSRDDSRNNSSSSTDTDPIGKMSDGENSVFDNHPKDDDLEDLDDVIFVKSSNPTREQKNYSPRERKSVNLQDIVFSETLIEAKPKQGGDSDSAKMMAPRNLVKKHRDETVSQTKGSKGYLNETVDNKNRSCKTLSTDGQNETQNSKTISDSKLSSKNGTGKKLDRSRLRKQAIPSDIYSLKVGPNLAVRESMRQYLKFRDADLSAFAVECVRHANKKKQILREEDETPQGDQVSVERKVAQEKLENASDTQDVDATEQRVIVVISSQDNDQQTDEANGLSDTQKLKSARSSGSSLLDNETAKEPVANESSAPNFFARTAEEAEWFEKGQLLDSVVMRKESLGRSSSQPPLEHASTSQRLYKFPSMPMFYIPNENEQDSESRKQKRISLALQETMNAGNDPFYHGEIGLKTKPARSNSSSMLTSKDENENEIPNKLKSARSRPKMSRRKISAPSISMTSTVRVDIEAHI